MPPAPHTSHCARPSPVPPLAIGVVEEKAGRFEVARVRGLTERVSSSCVDDIDLRPVPEQEANAFMLAIACGENERSASEAVFGVDLRVGIEEGMDARRVPMCGSEHESRGVQVFIHCIDNRRCEGNCAKHVCAAVHGRGAHTRADCRWRPIIDPEEAHGIFVADFAELFQML